MADWVVMARIAAKAKRATLRVDRSLDFPVSFDLRRGDTVEWKVRGVPAGQKARVRFVKGPRRSRAALFEGGKVLEAVRGVIHGGAINRRAPDGPYSYLVELVNRSGRITALEGVWTKGRKA